jgi:4-hydroxybenzoate polyprenyltransferase
VEAVKSFILHTHIFIGLCAAALTWGSQHMLQLDPLPGSYYAIVGLGTLVVYNMHRGYGLVGISRKSWPHRFSQFYKLRYWNILFSLVSIGLIFYLLVSHPFFLGWPLFIPPTLSILYILPLRNGNNLRHVPFIKIFLIAITWVWVSTYIPIWLDNKVMDAYTILFIFHRLLFIVAITIPFDIRDVFSDQRSNLQTLPSYYGVSLSRKYALGTAFLSLVPLIPFYIAGQFKLWSIPFYGVFMALVLYLIQKSSPYRSAYYFGYLLDGCLLVLGVLEVYLSTHF